MIYYFIRILPSVLFFLACVLPSIWIISVDEANRKIKFHHIVDHQESSIRDYVLSLEVVNVNHHSAQQSPRLLLNSSSSPSRTTTALLTTLTTSSTSGFLDLEKRAAPKYSHRKANHNSNNNHVSTKIIEKVKYNYSKRFFSIYEKNGKISSLEISLI